MTSEDLTKPESPPREVKPYSLKWIGGYLDLGDLDSTLRKPTTASKKSGSRAVGSKKGNKTDAPTGDPASAWREWKAREVAAEELMDVDPEDDGIPENKDRDDGGYRDGYRDATVLSAENNRGNSGNSRCQVWTYEMSEGTSASAYVLCPFQTLVPRFQNEEIGGSENGGSE